MKILFVVNENLDSGIRVYAETIAKELNKSKNFRVVIDKDFSNKYDLVHIHSCKPDNLAKTKLFQPFTPIVTSTHVTSGEISGLIPDAILNVVDIWLNTFYTSCEKIFVTSHHIFSDLKKNPLLRKKIVLLPYAVDTNRLPKPSKSSIINFKKKYNIPNKSKIVLCVASAQYRKGFFEFVDIAKKLSQYHFMWVGKIPEIPYLKYKHEIQEIVSNNKTKNLHFVGPLYGKNLSLAYSACDLFWLPSFSETFGIVIVEAASFGKPVLIRNIPVKELFKEFAKSYSTNPEKKIVELLENNLLRKELSKKALKKVNDFSLKNHTNKLVEEYKNVLQNK